MGAAGDQSDAVASTLGFTLYRRDNDVSRSHGRSIAISPIPTSYPNRSQRKRAQVQNMSDGSYILEKRNTDGRKSASNKSAFLRLETMPSILVQLPELQSRVARKPSDVAHLAPTRSSCGQLGPRPLPSCTERAYRSTVHWPCTKPADNGRCVQKSDRGGCWSELSRIGQMILWPLNMSPWV